MRLKSYIAASCPDLESELREAGFTPMRRTEAGSFVRCYSVETGGPSTFGHAAARAEYDTETRRFELYV